MVGHIHLRVVSSADASSPGFRVNIKLETRDIPPLSHLIDDLRDGTRLIQVSCDISADCETWADSSLYPQLLVRDAPFSLSSNRT